MAPQRTVTGKEAMASRCAEFIAAGAQIVTWADFEAAMAEWVVDLEAAKATQKERKRHKDVQKGDSRRRKLTNTLEDRKIRAVICAFFKDRGQITDGKDRRGFG